jgi:hypothetical protein
VSFFFLAHANKKGVSWRECERWQLPDWEQPTQPHPSKESNIEQKSSPSTIFGTFFDAQNQAGPTTDRDDVSGTTFEAEYPAAASSADVQLPRVNLPHPMIRPLSPCRDCGESFQYWQRDCYKDDHAKCSNHSAYGCEVTSCDRTFISRAERDAHERRPHISGHGRLSTSTPNDCIECDETLCSKADLLRHAKETQHQPYGCECGALFSRLDVLNRHLESFSTDDPKHPCKFCKLHRGPNGFRRLDHLMQHIRNYHHLELEDEAAMAESRLKYVFPVCSHPDCPQYRDETFKRLPRKTQAENKPFSSQSAYTKHMREEHNECPFPCDISGCCRTGRRGYFREKDLLKHRRQAHPDAPKYAVAKRELRVRCTEPDCDALLDPSSMNYHLDYH